ncbi:MAG: Inward rectifier potassium channel [Gammaproteobacteria bacterium]|nr:Inward rectifier potassium channel [Gammaproteobacteria bacterium]
MIRTDPSASGHRRPRHSARIASTRVQIGDREFAALGVKRRVLGDLYHYFMTVSWPSLFTTLAAFFLGFDLLFGWLYDLVPGCIANLNPPGFLGAFFFSVETLATVGYGDMHPASVYGHTIATIEVFTGLTTIALVTGIMFARFSRPRARFLFARNAVVRPIDGKPTLMFRAANARHNVIQEASAQLRMLRDEVTAEGFRIRRILDLPLVRAQHPVFALGWNIMHVIDPASPLWGASAESLRESRTSFILSLSGIDEATGHLLIGRAQFPSTAIHWNRAFLDILEESADGVMQVDYRKFHDVVPLAVQPSRPGEDEPPRRA